MKITPGPWTVAGHLMVGKDGSPICAISSSSMLVGSVGEREANARAIAEIPNLIEALREFLDLCPRVSDDDPIASALANQCRYAKLILKRIEG